MSQHIEFYRERLLEFSQLSNGTWKTTVVEPNGKKLSGADGETLNETIEAARQDIDFDIEELEIANELKPVIEKLLAKGHKPSMILMGFQEVIGQIKFKGWFKTQGSLCEASYELEQIEREVT